MPSNNVLVTGFGPFAEHTVNSSWEAVKLLPQHKINGVNIIIKEVPVTYQYIEDEIPAFWKTYDPKLVLHVGVSGLTDKLTIETQAFRMGYQKMDCDGNMHPTGESCTAKNGDDCIKTCLDADEICSFVNKKNNGLAACVSADAGRYLCEYIFYKSLNINQTRTLFVHVPPLDEPYSAEELAEGLANIIECALQQLCTCSVTSKAESE